MIKIQRDGNSNSDSKYLNMTKRELIEIIVSQQVNELRMSEKIKHLKGILDEESKDTVVVVGGMEMSDPNEGGSDDKPETKSKGKEKKTS